MIYVVGEECTLQDVESVTVGVNSVTVRGRTTDLRCDAHYGGQNWEYW